MGFSTNKRNIFQLAGPQKSNPSIRQSPTSNFNRFERGPGGVPQEPASSSLLIPNKQISPSLAPAPWGPPAPRSDLELGSLVSIERIMKLSSQLEHMEHKITDLDNLWQICTDLKKHNSAHTPPKAWKRVYMSTSIDFSIQPGIAALYDTWRFAQAALDLGHFELQACGTLWEWVHHNDLTKQ